MMQDWEEETEVAVGVESEPSDDGINEAATTAFIRSLIPNPGEAYSDMENYAREHRVPIIQPEVAQWLRTFLAVRSYERILEVGTAIGYSTSVLTESSGPSAIVDTIEIDPEKVELARNNLEHLGLSGKVNLHCGDAKDILEQLQGPYDLVFLDAAKGQYLRFLKQIEPMLADQAVVISDNVLFRGMLASKERFKRRKRTIVKRLNQYLNYLMTEGPYTSALMPLGDGMALSVYQKGMETHE